MSFWNLFRKQSQAHTVMAMNFEQYARVSEKGYEAFAKEAYQANVIAYRCISYVANAIAIAPVVVYEKRPGGKPKEIEGHAFYELLKTANPMQSWREFVRDYISYLQLDGNSFMEVSPSQDITKEPQYLYALRPDSMRVIPGQGGMPAAYETGPAAKPIRFPVDQLGRSAIVHMKYFHPLSHWRGMSPLDPAAFDIDQLNEANTWNYNLMKRGGRPSGALVLKGQDGGAMLDSNVRASLRKDIETLFSGSQNAGRPLLLEGGMEWQEMSMSPKDVEFPSIKKMSQKDVALAFGVAGQLVGVEGSQTFANYEQARLATYQDTILPLADLFMQTLTTRVLPRYKSSEKLYLSVDRDRIDALQPERDKLWEQTEKSTIITLNEKRERLDYEAYKDGEKDSADTLFISSSLTPIEIAAIAPLSEDTDAGDYEDEETDEPTKPKPDDDDEPSGSEAEDEDVDDEEDEKANLSLLNVRGDKTRIWKTLNRLRARHEFKMGTQLSKIFKAEGARLEQAFGNKIDPSLFDYVVSKQIDKSEADLTRVFTTNLKETAKTFGLSLFKPTKGMMQFETKGPQSVWDSSIQHYIDQEVGKKIKGIQRVSRKRILDSLRAEMQASQGEGESLPQLSKRIQEVYDGFGKGRAATIARTETHNAASYATLKAAHALKLPNMKKEWVHSQGDPKRSRDWHIDMNEETVDLNEKFLVPNPQGTPDEMDGPGDKSAPAEQVINCSCVLVFNSEKGEE